MTMIIRMIWFFNVLPPSKQLVSHIGIFPEFFVCLFDLIFTSHQQSFSYKETGLPGLNQY